MQCCGNLMTAARIHRLNLTNFRSYRAASRRVDTQLAVLVGPNGAGKTNLIEAISFLAPGRGLRRATLDEVAFSEGDGSWAVAAEIEGALGLATLGTGIEPQRAEAESMPRKFRIDGEAVTSAAAFTDHVSVVWMTPAMDGLFGGPASERRRFLDRLWGGAYGCPPRGRGCWAARPRSAGAFLPGSCLRSTARIRAASMRSSARC